MKIYVSISNEEQSFQRYIPRSFLSFWRRKMWKDRRTASPSINQKNVSVRVEELMIHRPSSFDYSNLPADFSPKIMREMKKQKQDGARILALIPPPVHPLILVAFAYFWRSSSQRGRKWSRVCAEVDGKIDFRRKPHPLPASSSESVRALAKYFASSVRRCVVARNSLETIWPWSRNS